MSRIDELIAELAPKGVEFKSLGELLGNIPRGRRLTKSNLAVDGAIPVYHGGLDPIGFHDRANTPGETVMIINTGASSGTVGWSEVPFWCSDGCFALPHSESFLARFLYYYASAHHRFFVDRVRRAGIPTLAADAVLSMRVPVPPLEVQQEIVRVLDKFTELEAELEAELDARHKQYEHYLNSLTHPFSEDRILKPGWTEAKMGDLCRIEKGRTAIQKAVPGPYPLVTTARDRGTAADFQFDGDAACIPLISSRGHGFASIARIYHQSGRFALGNILAAALPYDPNTLSAEFLRAYLQSRKDFILVPLMRGGANVSLTIDSLKRLKVHFPSIDEQRRIVQILRKFESLIGDSPFGIPEEIAARRKQYEYYRDKLLSFEELPA